MVYTPDGTSLTCEYCESKRNNRKDSRGAKLSEQDFLLSMATARGHTQLTESISIECEACGIQFILAPETLSFTCPHCSSTYVVNDNNVKQTITPGGIVLAKVSKEAAKAIIRRWAEENKISEITKEVSIYGFYLPVWWYSFAGQVNYKYYMEDKNRNRSQKQAFQDSRPVLRENVMVPAEERYEKQLNWQIENTNPDTIDSYLPEYLSDWAAETYQKSIADASLEARQVAFNQEKLQIKAMLPMNAEDVSFDSHQMMVDSYKLILLPCWIGIISTINGDIPLYLNADDGSILIRQEKPEPKSWWNKLFS
jgi:DNA-directed RNA polymerase subunit RPC12/RpoP